jgi:hypothetical protein
MDTVGIRKGIVMSVMGLGAVLGTAGAQTFPTPGSLPAIQELPDPFRMADGRRVATAEDWARRRQELKDLILHYEYGHFPPAPGNIKATPISTDTVLGGKAVDRRVRLSMGPGGKVAFDLRLLVPLRGTGPFPIVVKNDRHLGLMPIPEEAIDRGYIVGEFVRTQIAVDAAGRDSGAYPIYPDNDWGTLAAWAWGHMRVVDYLYTLDYVDKTRIAVTGQSRGGKTALLAGAMDERIALTAPNGSGAGGCGTYRYQGTGSESLKAITDQFPFWFHPLLKGFQGQVDRLPFDQHSLKALVAPRALLCNDALGDLWANPQGAQRSHWAAREVYRFLGAPDRIGLHYRPGVHEQNEDDWRTLLDFMDLQFFGKPSRRDFDTTAFPGLAPGFSWKAPAPASVIHDPVRGDAGTFLGGKTGMGARDAAGRRFRRAGPERPAWRTPNR